MIKILTSLLIDTVHIHMYKIIKKEQGTSWHHYIKFRLHNLQQETNLSLFLLSTFSVILELQRKLQNT